MGKHKNNNASTSFSKRKQYYKSVETREDRVLEAASKKVSQYKSTVYERLEKDQRLEQFKRLVSTAAAMGYNRQDTVKYISKYMPTYFSGNGLSVQTFDKMLQRYPDINDAWTVHRDNIAGAAVARISELIAKTNDLDLLLKIAKAFDNSGIVHDSDTPNYVPTKKTILISEDKTKPLVNNDTVVDSKNTTETISNLIDSYNAMVEGDISE